MVYLTDSIRILILLLQFYIVWVLLFYTFSFVTFFLYFVHLLDNAPEFGVCFHIEISILFHFLVNAKYLFEYLYIVLTMNPFKSEVCIAILFLCNGYFFLSFSLCVIGCNKLNLWKVFVKPPWECFVHP